MPTVRKARFEALGGSRIEVSTTPKPGAIFDEHGAYARWFAELGAAAVLVRPDHYVAFSAKAGDVERKLRRLLEGLHLTVPEAA